MGQKVDVVKITLVCPIDASATQEDADGLSMVIQARAVQPPPGPREVADPMTPIGFVLGARLSKMDVADMPATFVQPAIQRMLGNAGN